MGVARGDRGATVRFGDDSCAPRGRPRRAAVGLYLIGRIPWLTGKLRADGIALMVQGDPRLRRPYLVEVSPAAGPAAGDLAAYLRAPDTQQWIATFGRGRYDDRPLFFPVSVL